MSESNIQPRPVISVPIRPRDEDDREKLERALSDLGLEHPGMRVESGLINGETVIRGVGELHLQVICDSIA